MEKLQDCFNLTLDEFIEQLSSSSPTPGGGSTAALTGVLAASLISMVCNLTIGKKAYEEFQDLNLKSLSISQELIKELRECVRDDIKSYDNVMAALKLPKTDPEKREQALLQAFKSATETPEKTVEKCLEVIRVAKSLINKSNKNAVSDLYSAIYLGKAGISCALENVEINLEFINDQEYVSLKRKWLKEIRIDFLVS